MLISLLCFLLMLSFNKVNIRTSEAISMCKFPRPLRQMRYILQNPAKTLSLGVLASRAVRHLGFSMNASGMPRKTLLHQN